MGKRDEGKIIESKINKSKINEEEDNEVKHKIDFDFEGNLILKNKENVKRGAKSKSSGNQFELKVRHDLESRGFIVDKWTNNLEEEGKEEEERERDRKKEGKVVNYKIIPAKKRMGFINSQMRFMTLGTGFPDFIAFQLINEDKKSEIKSYKVIGVEVKMNGTLSKIEKEKCRWYLKNKIFSEILIASKIKEKNKVRVVYNVFKTN